MIVVSRRYLLIEHPDRHLVTLEAFAGAVEDRVELELRVGDDRLELIHRLTVDTARVSTTRINTGEVLGEDTYRELDAIVIEGDDVAIRLRRVADALAFLLGRPVELEVAGPTEFVAETKADADLLSGLDEPELDGGPPRNAVSMRTHKAVVCLDNVGFLLERSAGVSLYHAALRAQSPATAFRDLWRVLESAFQARDDVLVELLAEYPDAKAMGFDRNELRELLVLRGRASHAQSRSGLDEIVTVEQACRDRKLRLNHLVERVILNKSTWAQRSSGTNNIPLTAYIGSDGALVYFVSRADS